MTIGPPKSLTMGNSTNYSLNFHAKTILAQHNTLWGSRNSENKKCIDLIMMEDEHLCPCHGVTWLGANEQQPAGSSDPARNLSKRCAQTSPGLEEAAYALLAGGRWPFSGG